MPLNVRDNFAEWIHEPKRERSGETDFGCHWRLGSSREEWRVSWVEDTGELYAVNLQSGGGREDGKEFAVLAVTQGRRTVEEAMTGWAELCGSAGSLNIIAERLQVWDGRTEADLPPEKPKKTWKEDRMCETHNILIEAGTDCPECLAEAEKEEHWADHAEPDLAKVYVGQRPGDSLNAVIFVQSEGKETYPLRPVLIHTETPGKEHRAPFEGFEWGYLGSGVADTSISILADYFGERPTPKQLRGGLCRCWYYHQPFKEAFLGGKAQSEDLKIAAIKIAEWLQMQKPLPEEANQ